VTTAAKMAGERRVGGLGSLGQAVRHDRGQSNKRRA